MRRDTIEAWASRVQLRNMYGDSRIEEVVSEMPSGYVWLVAARGPQQISPFFP